MFFFKSLAVAATVAFGALSALAAPAPMVNNALAVRCGSCSSGVPTVIADLRAEIDVDIHAMATVTPDKCNPKYIDDLVVKVVANIDAATVRIDALVNADVKVILASVDGKAVVDVKILAKIVADLIISIVVAIQACIKVCTKVAITIGLDINIFINIFVKLGASLGLFVAAIIRVTAGVCVNLVAEIVACLGANIVAVIGNLKIAAILISALRLQL